MQGVSFGSMYALPIRDPQVMGSKGFRDLMRNGSPLIENDIYNPVNRKRKEYYVHVKEDNNGINDRTFESLARVCGVKVKKVNPTDENFIDTKVASERNVKQTKRFIKEAIKAGAPHKIEQENGIKRITLYNSDKGIFGIYNFDANTGKILEKVDYIDGKFDSLTKYDSKEQIKSIALINPNSGQGARLNYIA